MSSSSILIQTPWIEAAIHSLRKKGYMHANPAIEYIHSNQRRTAVEIVLQYYDQRYLQAINKRNSPQKLSKFERSTQRFASIQDC